MKKLLNYTFMLSALIATKAITAGVVVIPTAIRIMSGTPFG